MSIVILLPLFLLMYFMLIRPQQKAKLQQAWAEGLWEMSAQKSKADVEALRAFAKSKGL